MKYAILCTCLEEAKPLNLPLIQEAWLVNNRSSSWNSYLHWAFLSSLPSKRHCKSEFSAFLFSHFALYWARPKSQGFKVFLHLSLQAKLPIGLGLVFQSLDLSCAHSWNHHTGAGNHWRIMANPPKHHLGKVGEKVKFYIRININLLQSRI